MLALTTDDVEPVAVMDAVVTTDAVAVPPAPDAVAVTVTPALTTDAVAMPPMPDTAALDAKSAIAAHRDLPTGKLPEPQFD